MTPATEIIGPIRDNGTEVAPSPSLEQVREYIRASKAESTLRGYQAGLAPLLRMVRGTQPPPFAGRP